MVRPAFAEEAATGVSTGSKALAAVTCWALIELPSRQASSPPPERSAATLTLVDPAPDTPQFAEFRKMYFALFPKETTLARNTANTYDAAMLLLLAMAQAGGSENRVRLRNALFEVSREGEAFGPAEIPEAITAIRNGVNIDYKGASGNVDFDNFGNVRSDFIVWKVQDGALGVIEHIPAENIP